MGKKVWAVSMVKNEDDIIFNTLLNLADEGIDGIIIADNMSTDNTLKEIKKAKYCLEGSDCQIVIIEDNEVGYYQSKKITALAHKAHNEYGADFIIPFDADELWFSPSDLIKNIINGLSENVDVIQADLYNHYLTSLDKDSAIPFQSMCWKKKEKGALPKVAVKWHPDMVIEQGNHSVSLPFTPTVSNCLEIRHFPYRSWEQFKSKAINGGRAYEATNLPIGMGEHWRNYKDMIDRFGDELVKREVFDKYFYFASPTDNDMILDDAPFRRGNK